MSATSKNEMPLLCELGWHRPDQLARWNDGYYFSKCLRCERDLVRTAYGSWQLPKGYRVVWQPKPPETRAEIALVPSGDVVVAGARGDRVDFPLADIIPSDRSPIEPREMETPAPAPPPVAERMPQFEEPQLSEAPDPLPEPQEAPSPVPTLADETAPIAADAPLPQLVDPAPASHDDPGVPVVSETSDRPLAGDQSSTEFPVEELLQQPNGTAHTVEQHFSVGQDGPASILEDVPPQAREARNELPIAELLRHLNATPVPEPEVEPDVEPDAVADTSEEEAGPAIDPETEGSAEQYADSIQHAPVGADDTIDAASADDAIEPHASAASSEPAEPLDAAPEPDAAELPFEPALPPRETRSSVPDAPPGWDFMADEEEDPIGTFWEEPAPDPMPAPALEASTNDESAPEPEPEHATGESLPDERLESAAVPEQAEVREAVSAALPEARTEPVVAPPPMEPADPIAAPAPPKRTEPVREATWPRWMDADAETAPPEPVGTAAAARQSEVSSAVAPATRTASDPDDVPPWVDATDEETASDWSGSRSSRMAVTAVVSIVVLALAAAIAGRPDSSPTQVPQREGAPAATAAPAPKKPETSGAQAAATNMPFAKREPAFVSPGRPVSMTLPALAARKQAFVTASVLQCRSAPVNQSAAVRKLARGAEVQILARDGAWVSVAHKGRQCWAAARFLSAAEPW